MKTAKSVSRFVIEYMAGNAMPYAVKMDSIQLANPFKNIQEAVTFIHTIVDGISTAEVMVCGLGLSSIPEESEFDDVILVKVPANVVNLNVHISDNLMYMNYRGMPLQKKIAKIQDAVEEVKKFSSKVKETGGEITVRVECGPVTSKTMNLTEFERFAEYLVK